MNFKIKCYQLGCTVLLAVAAPALADVGDELLSAQAEFRQAMQAQTHYSQMIANLQTRLAAAEARQKEAEAEAASLKAELDVATAARTQTDATLQAAGSRLNAAWEAARQSGIRQ